MKLRRVLSLILVAALCLCMTACSGFSIKECTPILYRVTDAAGHTAWLFGSIHVGQEEFYPLPTYVLDAFDGADSLAVELDILSFEKNTAAQMQSMQALMYTDGTTIRDHLPEEVYQAAVEVLESMDSYYTLMDYYKPMMWSSMIDSLLYEQLGVKVDLGIDRHLIQRAYEAEKPIKEVESAQFQYEMMANFSEDLQTLLLQNSIGTYEAQQTTKLQLRMLSHAWATGNEQRLADMLTAETEVEDEKEKQLYEEYSRAMVDERNVSMTDFAEEMLRSGEEVFITVGAAHIIGDGAMVQLLKQRGYTVERVQ